MNEAERKAQILRSHAFATWWEAREHEKPLPTNPYQAYKIDLSLKAKVEDRAHWEVVPNRRDLILIDYPPYHTAPEYAPAKKPRTRNEPPYKSPELPKSGEARELTLASETMARRHGQPAPRVVLNPNMGPLSSHAQTGVGRYRYTGEVARAGGGTITIGTRGPNKIQKMATTAHETGHVIHAQNLFGIGHKLEGARPFVASDSSYSNEHEATKLAKAELKKTLKPKGEYPKAAWYLRYALSTYSKHKPDLKFTNKGRDILSGGD